MLYVTITGARQIYCPIMKETMSNVSVVMFQAEFVLQIQVLVCLSKMFKCYFAQDFSQIHQNQFQTQMSQLQISNMLGQQNNWLHRQQKDESMFCKNNWSANVHNTSKLYTQTRVVQLFYLLMFPCFRCSTSWLHSKA
jgi:hypothetical protein